MTDVDVFETPIAQCMPTNHRRSKGRTRGRGRGCGRGHGRGIKVESTGPNVTLLGNESAFTDDNELQVYGATGDTSPE